MRVLLADDHRLMLEGLRNLLEAHGVDVVGEAEDGFECLQKARELRPDVILMDIAMPRCDGLAATRLVKAELPEVKVVILTASGANHDLFEAVRSGATGFLLKSIDAQHLMEALENALHGAPPLAPELAARLLGEFVQEDAKTAGPPPDERLSARQEEILTLLAQGLSYREVADRVSLTPRTVKYHMGEIMRKLHLRNRAQVLAHAGSMGLVPPPTVPGDREKQS